VIVPEDLFAEGERLFGQVAGLREVSRSVALQCLVIEGLRRIEGLRAYRFAK
jgi:hypothetical protein